MRTRARTGLLLAAVVVLLLLLAIGINGMQFLPGRPFNVGAPAALPSAGGGSPNSRSDITLLVLRALFIAALVLFPVAFVFMALTPEGRRQLMAYAIMIAGLVIIFMLLSNPNRKPGGETPPNRPAPQATAVPAAAQPPTDVFTGNVPDWLTSAISIGLAVVICGIVAAVVYLVWRRSRAPRSALDALAGEAQQALNALQAGGELKDTVLRCYREMSRVLQQERGIRRQESMTAREFEDALTGKGIPQEPVRALTRLFEQVRYGRERPGAREEQLAVDSLGAIVAACKAAAATPTGVSGARA